MLVDESRGRGNPFLAPVGAPVAGESVVCPLPAGGGGCGDWVPVGGVGAVPALPRIGVGEEGGLWVVGAHGGAGASVWAGLLGLPECAGAWPVAPAGAPAAGVVVVCRTSAAGLAAARRMGIEWAGGGVPVRLVGVVAGADAPGRLPRALREAWQMCAGAFPRGVLVPWQTAWRTWDPHEGEAPVSAAVRRAIKEITTWKEQPS